MSQERQKVLQMLADGKISPEDAGRLLDRLEEARTAPEEREEGSETEEPSRNRRLRWLRVVVNEGSGEKVNIRVPLAFVRAGLRLGSVMPASARKSLQDRGFDLNHLGELDGSELTDALRELNIQVDEKDGDQVRIFCE